MSNKKPRVIPGLFLFLPFERTQGHLGLCKNLGVALSGIHPCAGTDVEDGKWTRLVLEEWLNEVRIVELVPLGDESGLKESIRVVAQNATPDPALVDFS